MGNWLDNLKDSNIGIETIRAHFTGHAYDPHWQSSYLIGVTESGIQQFHFHWALLHKHSKAEFSPIHSNLSDNLGVRST